ncbi:MAG: heat-inducible transcriptional repressor HrcA [Actinomycetota bacterium]
MELTERKKEILKEVVVNFVEGAEPVSSKMVLENSALDISSATIRNEMSELEDMGYLTHPHTSAGRIPTDKGYRFYVDNLMDKSIAKREEGDLPSINFDFSKDLEIEAILKKSSKMLAQFTNYLSMVVAPTLNQSRFRHIELLKFQDTSFLMVLITDSGRVYKRHFSLSGSYTSMDLQGVANILNMQLKDKPIVDIDMESVEVPKSDAYLIILVKKVVELIKDYANAGMQYNRIFMHGASGVLNQPDFIDLAKIRKVLRFIENEYLLMKLLLDSSSKREFIIKIGSEIFDESISDLSLIASKYKIHDKSSGAIGVLGPKRMDYPKVIRILDIFRVNLSDYFGSKS